MYATRDIQPRVPNIQHPTPNTRYPIPDAQPDELIASAARLDWDAAREALVAHYYVAPGDHVRAGDPVALLRTDRYAYDIPANRDGVVGELLVVAGERVVLGTP